MSEYKHYSYKKSGEPVTYEVMSPIQKFLSLFFRIRTLHNGMMQPRIIFGLSYTNWVAGYEVWHIVPFNYMVRFAITSQHIAMTLLSRPSWFDKRVKDIIQRAALQYPAHVLRGAFRAHADTYSLSTSESHVQTMTETAFIETILKLREKQEYPFIGDLFYE